MMIHDDCKSSLHESFFLISVVYEIFKPGYHDFHLAARVHHENRCQTARSDCNTVDDEGREALYKKHELVRRTEVHVQNLDVERIG